MFVKSKLQMSLSKIMAFFIQMSVVLGASVFTCLMRNAKFIFQCLFAMYLVSGFLVEE